MKPPKQNDFDPNWDHGQRLVASLPLSMDGPERATAFREVVALSAKKALPDSNWALEATIQAYRLAGEGIWPVENSMHDVIMLISAVEDNPSILPEVEGDLERVLQRFERIGCSFRPTWDFIKKKICYGQTGKGEAA